MPIKHLVLSGGGPIGVSFLGAIEHLVDEEFINIDEIESIYATSIGTVMSTILCLNYDWQTINKYVIERPWQHVFKLNAKQIMETYTNKGLYDISVIEKTFKPLLEAKDLSLSITLKEFCKYCKKDIHFFAFDLNTYRTVELSHKEYPDLSLLKAIYISCSLPGIFIPTIMDGKCLIDGGSLANFPLNYCLRDHSNKEEVLGFNFVYRNDDGTECSGNNIINDESDMLDFILALSLNSVNYITNSIKYNKITNILEFCSNTTTLTIENISHIVGTIEGRQTLFNRGIEVAKQFLILKEKEKEKKNSLSNNCDNDNDNYEFSI
jgi:predicted acylesterase/phospholipase RssA